VVHLHLLRLPNAHGTPYRLPHERTRPPRAHEDNVGEMLQVESHAPALDVEQQDHVPFDRLLRRLEGSDLLLLGEAAVVLDDGVVAQLILQQIHLVPELAEDDPANTGLLAHELLDGGELGTGSIPGIPCIAEGFSLPRPDVDLRVDGELAELHEELEAHGGLVTVEGPPPLHQLALDALVELTLLLGLKVEGHDGVVGSGGQVREDRPELLHGAMEERLADQGLEVEIGRKADEGEEVGQILGRVHHGSGSDWPRRLPLDGRDPLVHLSIPVTQVLVGLIEAEAVEGLLEEILLARDRVIVGDVDTVGRLGLVHGTPVALAGHVDGELAADAVTDPLGDEGLGAEEEGGHLRRVQDEAEDLLGLAEAHVVAQEAAAYTGRLALEHPVDADQLVGLVLAAGRGREVTR